MLVMMLLMDLIFISPGGWTDFIFYLQHLVGKGLAIWVPVRRGCFVNAQCLI